MRVPAIRKAWTTYAAVLTFAVIAGEFSNLVRGEPITWLMLANWVVTLVLLTATWGYALRRPIATEQYWRRVFWILLLATALMLIRVALASTVALVLVLALMALLVPAYVAAHLYAFRSSELWRGTS
jgi:hypothetical protein